jgi:hypothetical protein
MSTKITTSKGATYSADGGNGSIFVDTMTGLDSTHVDSGDVLQLCRVPGGTLVHRVVIKTPDLDTALDSVATLTAEIGFTAIKSGSTLDSNCVQADGSFGRSSSASSIEVFPPYRVEEDAYLTITFGTAAATKTGGDGTVYAKVEGEALGVK